MIKVGQRNSENFSRKQLSKMKKNSKIMVRKPIDAEGVMTYGQLDNGLKTLDFTCLLDMQLEATTANFKVQQMRDGNIYMTEIPKRVRNNAIFRDDNASLSLGQNGRYYFVFTLPEERIDELAKELVRQASVIAQKVIRELFNEGRIV